MLLRKLRRAVSQSPREPTPTQELPKPQPLEGHPSYLKAPLESQTSYGKAPIESQATYFKAPIEGQTGYHKAPIEGQTTYFKAPVEGQTTYLKTPVEGQMSYGKAPLEGQASYLKAPIEGEQTGYHKAPIEGQTTYFKAPVEGQIGYHKVPVEGEVSPWKAGSPMETKASPLKAGLPVEGEAISFKVSPQSSVGVGPRPAPLPGRISPTLLKVVTVLVAAALVVTSVAILVQRPTSPGGAAPKDYALGYASDGTQVLIRWTWNTTKWNSTAYPDLGFRVYRQPSGGSEVQLQEPSEVQPVTDADEVVRILNTTDARWPHLFEDLCHNLSSPSSLATFSNRTRTIDTVESLRAFLAANGTMAHQLADERYPLSLVLGWGYLDRGATAGTRYTYRLEVVYGGKALTLGSVSVVAGRATPLPTPQDLQEVMPTFSTDPKNNTLPPRALNGTVFLNWSAAVVDSAAPEWVVGYDLQRSRDPVGRFTSVSGDIPIQLRPRGASASQGPSFDFADRPPTSELYRYRVAAVDLLGHSASSPSPALQVRVRNTVPPPAPMNLTAFVWNDRRTVQLNWTLAATPDLAGFRVYRCSTFFAPLENWSLLEEFDASPVGQNGWAWSREEAAPADTVLWYRVEATDTDGNVGDSAGPVQAVVRGGPGPAAPSVRMDSNGSVLISGPDAATNRVYCQFGTGGPPLLVADLPNNQAFDMSRVYRPSSNFTDVQCWARSVDAQGTVGAATSSWAQPLKPMALPEAPKPMIQSIETAPSAGSTWKAVIRWTSLYSRFLDSYQIHRANLTGEPGVWDSASLNPQVYCARANGSYNCTYQDTGVRAGGFYSYSVTSHFPSSAGGSTNTSEPHVFKVVVGGNRALDPMPWLELVWQATGLTRGTYLAWDCDGHGSAVCTGVSHPEHLWAVFRSVHPDRDFIQLTPVWKSDRANYTDASAQWSDYWYQVIEFDGRTGEPIRNTTAASPRFVRHVPLLDWDRQYLNPPWEPSSLECGGAFLNLSKPLRFGDGFDLYDVVYTDPYPYGLAGHGTLTLSPPTGNLNLRVDFEGIGILGTENHVCQGTVPVDLLQALGAPLHVDGEMSYDIYSFELNPYTDSPNAARARILIQLPPEVHYANASGMEFGAVPLVNASLHPNLDFSLWFDASTASCAHPPAEFRQETLPTAVVPTGMVHATPAGIDFAPQLSAGTNASCMAYLDRYTGSRAAAIEQSGAGANDGWLEGTYQSSGTVRLDGTGFHGAFGTEQDRAWTASYPFGFGISVVGSVNLTLEGSRIQGGLVGQGSVSVPNALTVPYHTEVSGPGMRSLPVALGKLLVEPGGSLFALGNITATIPGSKATVDWMSGGFSTTEAAWRFFAGRITTLETPEKEMWRARPNDAVDIPELGSASLEPGLNLRRSPADLGWSNCRGPRVIVPTSMDLYLRRGGPSGRILAHLDQPLDLDLNFYASQLSKMDLYLLDGAIWDRDARGVLSVERDGQPSAAGFSLPLVNIWWYDNGCVGGADVPNTNNTRVLRYWQIRAAFHAIAFRPDLRLPLHGLPPEDPRNNWTLMLWTIGSFEIPHMNATDATGVPAALGLEFAFDPWGSVMGSRLSYDRADYYLDGMPILLERLELSAVGQRPGWNATATLLAPPSVPTGFWDSHGYVNATGPILVPYFGPVIDAQGQHPQVIVLGWNETYVGLEGGLGVSKDWNAGDDLTIHWAYHLLYVHNPEISAGHRGMLLGFATMTVRIGGASSGTLFTLDSTLVLDGRHGTVPLNLGIYLGLSSGPAVVLAVEEATGRSDPALATVWMARVGLVDPATSSPVATWYGTLVSKIHAQYGAGGYRDVAGRTERILGDLSPQSDAGLLDSLRAGTFAGADLALGGDLSALELRWMLGSVGVVQVSPEQDVLLNDLSLGVDVDFHMPGGTDPFFSAPRLTLHADRYGDYLILGDSREEGWSVLEQDLSCVGLLNHVALRLAVDAQGILVYGTLNEDACDLGILEKAPTVAMFAAGVAVDGNGVAHTVYYYAAGSSVRLNYPVSASLGGFFIKGRFDPCDPILDSQLGWYGLLLCIWGGFSHDLKTGFFLIVFGGYRLIDFDCWLRLEFGGLVVISRLNGELAVVLAGYVSGDALCIASAEATLVLFYTEHDQTWSLGGAFTIRVGVGKLAADYGVRVAWTRGDGWDVDFA